MDARHIMEVTGRLNAMAGLTPGKDADIHWVGGWVSHRADLDVLPLPVFEPLIMRTYITQKLPQ